jgi:hypothetical protein
LGSQSKSEEMGSRPDYQISKLTKWRRERQGNGFALTIPFPCTHA